MAKTEKNNASGSEDIQAQIELTINQLIQLTLFQIGKQYNLRLENSSFSKVFQPIKKPINTALYSLKVHCDYNQVQLEVTLKMEGVNEIIRRHRLRDPKWAFLSFIKEEPYTLDHIEHDENFWRLAETYTQNTGTFRRGLKSETPYYALFLVAFKDDDTLVLEADVATMIELPPVPSIEQVTMLKEKLTKLSVSSGAVNEVQANDFDDRLETLYAKYNEIRESLVQRETDEARLETLLEEINYNQQIEIRDLINDYKK